MNAEFPFSTLGVETFFAHPFAIFPSVVKEIDAMIECFRHHIIDFRLDLLRSRVKSASPRKSKPEGRPFHSSFGI
jgi:hypothetical protein